MSGSYSITARAKEILGKHGVRGLINHASQSVVRNWREWRFRPYITQQEIAGERLTLRIADQFGHGWYGSGHDWKEAAWIKDRLIEQGGTVVDVGTNHGITAVLFAKWIGPSGEVIAIDGRRENVETARENAALNHAPNIHCIHTAVGSRAGTIEFMDQPNGAVLTRAGAARKTVTVPLRTLDEILEGKRASFLKIDVEGYEVEVLRGATETLKSVPNLDVEIHCASFADPTAAVREILTLIG
ncbi:MAG TPA: FkbM family methyltransferase, partial [Polyangia bacterium]|nr:FkbM family methyltransferase [Polyangia bacterium]